MFPRASTVCEVEILTTASITFSATSAIASDPRTWATATHGDSAIVAARANAAVERRARRGIARLPTMGLESPENGSHRQCADRTPDARCLFGAAITHGFGRNGDLRRRRQPRAADLGALVIRARTK